ncbi:MAG TPA: PAS domain-containing sensor histidine kinase [Leptolyngbyaceae cyanobacterium M65_K2018_010]|nr:PAS domain-containing sensor histidine kinase [Leptolyngbyaceae cyanobacterium M65_K2018_010]
MAVFWYLVGLLTGALLLMGERRRQRRREQRLFSMLEINSWGTALERLQDLIEAHPQQQQQLHQLSTSRDALAEILQQAPIGYLQVDEENQLVWCNQEANRLLRMNQALTGSVERRRLLLEVARSYELDALIDEVRQRQRPCQREWMLYQISPDPLHPKEEATYPLRGYGIPLPGQEVGIFLENRQEAARLIQQRDRWTSDVAHELKTPLTSIRLVAETLQSRVDPSLTTWLDRLINETIRLSNLVEDLLNLTRLQGDQWQRLNWVTVDLPPLIQSAWRSLEPLAEVKRLGLNYQGPTQLLASVDETLFQRVLLNLLDNAIKHSPMEGSIQVRLGQGQAADGGAHFPVDSLVLEVIDQGPGFDPKDLPYIFDRFYRADPARSRNPSTFSSSTEAIPPALELSQGTGLGLAIVHQIVAAHGGSIRAANHPELGGAWLQLHLPCSVAKPRIYT